MFGVLGSKNGRSKLVEDQVKDIKFKLKKGFKIKELADLFEVSGSIIQDIKLEKTWKQVEI